MPRAQRQIAVPRAEQRSRHHAKLAAMLEQMFPGEPFEQQRVKALDLLTPAGAAALQATSPGMLHLLLTGEPLPRARSRRY